MTLRQNLEKQFCTFLAEGRVAESIKNQQIETPYLPKRRPRVFSLRASVSSLTLRFFILILLIQPSQCTSLSGPPVRWEVCSLDTFTYSSICHRRSSDSTHHVLEYAGSHHTRMLLMANDLRASILDFGLRKSKGQHIRDLQSSRIPQTQFWKWGQPLRRLRDHFGAYK